jgi:hypothetical protein
MKSTFMKTNSQTTTGKYTDLNKTINRFDRGKLSENINSDRRKSCDNSRSINHKRHSSNMPIYEKKSQHHNHSINPVSPYLNNLQNHSHYYTDPLEREPFNYTQSDVFNVIQSNTSFKPRKWKMGLREKLDLKHKYLDNPEKRQEKIKRCLDKERIKCRVGQRIHLQNQILLQQMRKTPSKSITNSHRATSLGYHHNQSRTSDDIGRTTVVSRLSIPRSTMQDSYAPE